MDPASGTAPAGGPCQTTSDCLPGVGCFSGVCRQLCKIDDNCPRGYACSNDGACLVSCTTGVNCECESDAECGEGDCECADYACSAMVCSGADCVCRFNADGDATCDGDLVNVRDVLDGCAAPDACRGGRCLGGPNTGCLTNSDCLSDVCTSGTNCQ